MGVFFLSIVFSCFLLTTLAIVFALIWEILTYLAKSALKSVIRFYHRILNKRTNPSG